MCREGSYIENAETTDSVEFVKNGSKVLFVTSDDLKSVKGKKVVESGGSLQGHTAIKQIFGVKSGVDKEADLSDPDLMPKELAEAIRKGKFVGVWTSTKLLSDKGITEFEKQSQKISKLAKDPKNGKHYAITEAFWKIFKASSKNRAEAWA